jgi:class 3 adenylate cyclase
VDEAAEHYQSSLAWCERERLPIEAGRCLQGLAEVAERRGERAEALQMLDRAAALFQQHGARLYLDRVITRKLELQGIASGDIYTSIDRVATAVQSEQPDLRRQAAPDGTVTIMFSDIEGSTEKTAALGDKAWMDVLREHNAIVREQIKANDGFEVKSEGDGFMVAFQSARKAVECAIAIQEALDARDGTVGAPLEEGGGAGGAAPGAGSGVEPVRVRIGLHAGEVIKEGEDFFGRNVIMAARVASQACGGEILVSSVLKALMEGSDVPWGASRTVELKGLSGEHEIWPVQWS